MYSLLVTYIGAATLLTITPGVDTALVLRTAAGHGRGPAMMAALGTACGCMAWGLAASLGLGLLLAASEWAYRLVKLAGAGYLLWMGVRLVLRPRQDLGPGGPREAVHEAWRRGFLTNMLNPKVGVFYVTFLPQFIPAGVNVSVWSFILALIHVALILIWFAILVAATAPLGSWLKRPKVIRTLDRVTGCVFVGFGLKLAASPAAP